MWRAVRPVDHLVTARGERMSYRAERIAAMIHREVAERLRSEIKDPRLVTISITGVTVNRDLSKAVVRWLPLGGGAAGEGVQQALEDAGRKLRGPIGRALRLRHAPEIAFSYDSHTEQAFAVNRLIDQLSAEREHGEESEE